MSVRPPATPAAHNSLSTTVFPCSPALGNQYVADWECRFQWDKFLGEVNIIHHYVTNDKNKASRYAIPYSPDYDCVLLRMTTNKRIWLKPRDSILLQVSGPHPTRPRSMITVCSTVLFGGCPPIPDIIRSSCSMLAWLFEPINDGQESKFTHIYYIYTIETERDCKEAITTDRVGSFKVATSIVGVELQSVVALLFIVGNVDWLNWPVHYKVCWSGSTQETIYFNNKLFDASKRLGTIHIESQQSEQVEDGDQQFVAIERVCALRPDESDKQDTWKRFEKVGHQSGFRSSSSTRTHQSDDDGSRSSMGSIHSHHKIRRQGRHR
ncbi:hypothetical protein PPL_04501 [Heterostelium album PN500]|uniref:START domain-containing protein n=1 Tax=Heterostelium pallidum (strain ATCC 26659 / Pp 5 / PN500) TaxID=670386 RepID=D3B7R3_HETP5|nr:hypothetical protein PPL_04501 [Heterostelium album PN500]EFA82806.1 hypothetical protein PPL_04501 [Heterostelium album PN500]|eukprot:XP_020434923.1 hypothetical protein PPL_04501 [Heterostelium album PN500]